MSVQDLLTTLSQEKKSINANPKLILPLTSLMKFGMLDFGTIINLTNDCSRQRSLTEWGKTRNRYVTLRQECTWWRISWGMRTKQRRHKVNKDDMTYIKEQRSINRWPCVRQIYLVVQLSLRQGSAGPGSGNFPICFRKWDPDRDLYISSLAVGTGNRF